MRLLQCCGVNAPSNRWPRRCAWSHLIDDRFSEVGYGEWTGKKNPVTWWRPLWQVVRPPAAVPGGEGLAQVQTCAVAADPRTRPAAGRSSTATTCCVWHPWRCHQGGDRRRVRYASGPQRITADGFGVVRYTQLPVLRQPPAPGWRLCQAGFRPGASPRTAVPGDAVIGGSTD